MEFSYLIKGLISGVIISFPIGPMGMICLRNTLRKGRIHGLASGVGAAVCDALYAAVICFGLTFVSNFLTDHRELLRILSGLMLCGIGLVIYFAKTSGEDISVNGKNVFGSFISTFLLSFSNPMIIFTFIALFTALGVGTGHMDFICAVFLVIGVFLGSASWWMVLITDFDLGRIRIGLDTPVMKTIKKTIGIIIMLAGIITVFVDFSTLGDVANSVAGIFK
ncbi:MAG: LysE family transporter [Bacillota bacterium]|nr:LysE family transporter [Bacillota bacterium]